MRFLLKVAFWLTIVVLLLPAEQSDEGQQQQVSALDALSAAQSAVQDAGGFCDRNPHACDVGAQAFQTFGEKAQYGAKLLYEFLSARFAGDDAQTATGSISAPQRPGEHTLTPADMEPAWSASDPEVPNPQRRPI